MVRGGEPQKFYLILINTDAYFSEIGPRIPMPDEAEGDKLAHLEAANRELRRLNIANSRVTLGEFAEATRQIEELKALRKADLVRLKDYYQCAATIPLRALKTLLDPLPGAALNAVREDYPEFARLVEEFRNERKVL